jgi:hypothetical protein
MNKKYKGYNMNLPKDQSTNWTQHLIKKKKSLKTLVQISKKDLFTKVVVIAPKLERKKKCQRKILFIFRC